MTAADACSLYAILSLLIFLKTGICYALTKVNGLRSVNSVDEDLFFGEMSNPTAVVILVHGTWARGGTWHKDGSSFLKNLRRCLEELSIEKGIISRPRFYRCLWGGGNTLLDRFVGIERVQLMIAKVSAKNPGIPIFIIAHSHGGNIVVKALSRDRDMCEKVSGVCCVSTPFLMHFRDEFGAAKGAARRRHRLDKLAKILGLAIPLSVSFFVVFYNMVGLFACIVMLTAIAIVILIYTRWCNKTLTRTTLHDEEIGDDLFQKILPIRAAGDEASAALGAAYLMKYAFTSPVRMLNTWLDVKYYSNVDLFDNITVVEEKILSVLKNLIIPSCVFCAVILFMAWKSQSWEMFYFSFFPFILLLGSYLFNKFSFILFKMIIGILSFSVTLVRFTTTVTIYSVTGFFLFPFAPELLLSTSLVGVTAEAALARRGSGIGRIVQLAGDRRPLNHSAYNHKDIALIISKWLTNK